MPKLKGWMTNSSSRPHISHIPLSASPIRWKLCVQLVYANLASFHGRISTWIHPSLWSGWTCSWLIASLSTTDYPLTQQNVTACESNTRDLFPLNQIRSKKEKKGSSSRSENENPTYSPPHELIGVLPHGYRVDGRPMRWAVTTQPMSYRPGTCPDLWPAVLEWPKPEHVRFRSLFIRTSYNPSRVSFNFHVRHGSRSHAYSVDTVS